jgi:hypothetical protein
MLAAIGVFLIAFVNLFFHFAGNINNRRDKSLNCQILFKKILKIAKMGLYYAPL